MLRRVGAQGVFLGPRARQDQANTRHAVAKPAVGLQQDMRAFARLQPTQIENIDAAIGESGLGRGVMESAKVGAGREHFHALRPGQMRLWRPGWRQDGAEARQQRPADAAEDRRHGPPHQPVARRIMEHADRGAGKICQRHRSQEWRPDRVKPADIETAIADQRAQAPPRGAARQRNLEARAAQADGARAAQPFDDDTRRRCLRRRRGARRQHGDLVAQLCQRRTAVQDMALDTAGPVDVIGADGEDFHDTRRSAATWV
jgi:hypothetical protein